MEQTQLIEYFENSEVNQKLLKLYESKWDIVLKVRDTATNNKELVFHSSCIPHNYKEMKHKILVVGQETNGWEFNESVKDSMLFTLRFLYSPQHNGKLSFTFPFDFCKSVNNYNYDENYRKTYFAWVSLRKFAYDENHEEPLNKEAQNIIDSEFNILEEEIKIISPDIVLFLTGPNYDNYIKNQLKGVEFKTVENYHIRQFARVEHKSLPENSFRIYNTSYLAIKKLENEYLQELVKECRL